MLFIINLFRNVSVRGKLAIGFGLVCLCLVISSALGLLSINLLLDRFEKLNKVASISDVISDARENERRFQNSLDASYVKRALEQVETATQIGNSSKLLFDTEESQALMDRVIQESQQYRDVLGQYQALTAQSARAQEIMEQKARDVLALMVELENRFTSQALTWVGESNEAQQVYLEKVIDASAASKAILQARRYEKNYVITGDSSDFNTALEQIDLAEKRIGNLLAKSKYAQLNQRMQASLSELAEYRQALRDYSSLNEQSDDLLATMSGQASEMIRSSSQSVERQLERLREQSESLLAWIIAIASFAIVFSFITAYVISGSLVKPIHKLLAVAEKVAQGDLTAELHSSRKDEVGQLMNAVQSMTDNLKMTIRELSGGVSQLAVASEQMSAVSEQNRVQAGEQKVQTEQVATAMTEMASTVQEVARSAEETLMSTNDSREQVQLGESVVNKAVQKVTQLTEKVQQSHKIIQDLKDETVNISDFLSMIKNITEQTNLLALNAAIEAARAGEAGRGFSVVAEEVRNLANRTQQSTIEIEQIITNLISKADEASLNMESSASLASITYDAATEASQTISLITQAIEEIRLRNEQIASAAMQQSTVAEQVNGSVVVIRDAANDTAVASEQSATASQELKDMGYSLKQLSEKFHIA